MGLATILWNMLDETGGRRRRNETEADAEAPQEETVFGEEPDLHQEIPGTTPRFAATQILNSEPKTEVRMIEYNRRCGRGKGKDDKGKDEKGLFHFMKCEDCCIDPETGAHNLIMAPPAYGDLGKNAGDIFNKGYHFGLIKLDCKTKTGSGVEFNTGGSSNQETGKVFGSLETKYNLKEHGMTFSEKWNTDNTLGTEISVQDKLVKGLKLTANCTFAPQTGNKSGTLSTAYNNDYTAINANVDLDQAKGPIIQGSAVIGYQGWLAGYQAAFDAENKKLTKNNFALGFSTGDFILHTNVDDGREFGGSIYQRVSPRLETGIQLAWSSGSNDTKFGIGAKYDLDRDAAIRAKVDNTSQIGLGYQQRLRDGITLTLSALIDGKNFNGGGHKIGLALELEA
ncbi:voltage-dependent anion-selective channel-like isoform X2 [Onthophagus taurus]|uniref:voltage-dependent anion-selective channel-like isoform X2 n=2 Tax=Onthophagus taurus TaxID=166361 RepID=UPI000C203D9B|nr:voltage-dependent anion-selective channel-like isoform X1 [Onthophagus taurus]